MKNYTLVDLTKDYSKYSKYLSNTLLTQMGESLKDNKKIILYINKRWAYDLSICQECSYIKKCSRCDISMSVHKKPPKYICHHCFFQEDILLKCDKCNWNNLVFVWVWTEQIEEVLKNIFPKINIFRMDSDNLKNNTLKKEALNNLNNANIIIWTKMITTWFDFRNIWLIWIILLEQELQIPFYDTEEKIYQNTKQLLWRWWRLWEKTQFLIQTFSPQNEIILDIINLNYNDFLNKTLKERKFFKYPPFLELATLRYKNKDKNISIDFIQKLKNKLDNLNNWEFEILLIDVPIKRDNQFFTKIIIKWENIKWFLQNIKKDIFQNKDLVVIFD